MWILICIIWSTIEQKNIIINLKRKIYGDIVDLFPSLNNDTIHQLIIDIKEQLNEPGKTEHNLSDNIVINSYNKRLVQYLLIEINKEKKSKKSKKNKKSKKIKKVKIII
jgi:hypothetical protein